MIVHVQKVIRIRPLQQRDMNQSSQHISQPWQSLPANVSIFVTVGALTYGTDDGLQENSNTNRTSKIIKILSHLSPIP